RQREEQLHDEDGLDDPDRPDPQGGRVGEEPGRGHAGAEQPDPVTYQRPEQSEYGQPPRRPPAVGPVPAQRGGAGDVMLERGRDREQHRREQRQRDRGHLAASAEGSTSAVISPPPRKRARRRSSRRL